MRHIWIALALALALAAAPCLARAEGREIFSYDIGKLDGLGFTPYTKNQSAENPHQTITDEQIRSRLDIIAPYTERIRTFGCANGLERIPRIASEEYGLGVAVGIWISEDAEANAAQIKSAVKAADWAEMYIFAETLNLGNASLDTLIGCIRSLRKQLKSAGHSGIPIVTGEPLSIYENEGAPLLDEVSMLCFNYHPHYDGITPEDAGRIWFPAMLDRAQALAAPYGLDVVVGETGFPTYSDVSDDESARLGAAAYHLWAEYEARKRGVIAYSFNSFDEGWKVRYNPAEAQFGIWDEQGNLKLPELFAGSDSAFSAYGPEYPAIAPEDPAISVEEWPSDANGFRVKGSVQGIGDPSDYRVMVWVRIGGRWWVKPTWDSALQFVGPDYSFNIAAITPGATNDPLQDACTVLLIPAGSEPDIYVYESNLPLALAMATNE